MRIRDPARRLTFVTVTASWARIMRWVGDHTPTSAATVRPPAGAAALTAAQKATGRVWPPDLIEWFQLMDGTERSPAGYLLPGHCPMPLSSVVQTRSMLSGLVTPRTAGDPLNRNLRSRPGAPEPDDPYDVERLDAQPAGSPTPVFLPSFLPIADDQNSNYLVVDTRAGALHGCVLFVDKVEAVVEPRGWDSVAVMLTDLADALESRRVIGTVAPEVDGHRLTWF